MYVTKDKPKYVKCNYGLAKCLFLLPLLVLNLWLWVFECDYWYDQMVWKPYFYMFSVVSDCFYYSFYFYYYNLTFY